MLLTNMVYVAQSKAELLFQLCKFYGFSTYEIWYWVRDQIKLKQMAALAWLADSYNFPFPGQNVKNPSEIGQINVTASSAWLAFKLNGHWWSVETQMSRSLQRLDYPSY